MNKSKFLKKSLAALLAVMLVVAMIPLSAAAAVFEPVIWVEDWETSHTAGSSTYSVTKQIANVEDVEISSNMLSADGKLFAVATDTNGDKIEVELVDGSHVNLNKFATKSGNTYTLNLENRYEEDDKDGNPKVVATYTLTITNESTPIDKERSISKVVHNDLYDPASYEIEGNTITMILPFGAGVPEDLDGNLDDTTTPTAKSIFVPVSKKASVAFTAASAPTAGTTEVGKIGDVVVTVAGGTKKYEVKAVYKDLFSSLSVEGEVEHEYKAVWAKASSPSVGDKSETAATLTVTMPYGTATKTIVPTFVKGGTISKIEYTNNSDTRTVESGKTLPVYTGKDPDDASNGANGNTNSSTTGTGIARDLIVTADNGKSYKVTLTVKDQENNPNAKLTSVQIKGRYGNGDWGKDSNVIEFGDATSVPVMMPKGFTGTTADIDFVVSKGAKVQIVEQSKSVNDTTVETGADGNAAALGTSSTDANATATGGVNLTANDGKVTLAGVEVMSSQNQRRIEVQVTSADGETTARYYITVSVAAKDEAFLNSLTFKNDTTKEIFEIKNDWKNEGNGSYSKVVSVPYKYRLNDELNALKVYANASVGATVTGITGGSPANGNTVKQWFGTGGSSAITAADYFEKTDGTPVASKLDITVTNNGDQNVYHVTFRAQAAKTGHGLRSAVLTDNTNAYSAVTENNKYVAEIGTLPVKNPGLGDPKNVDTVKVTVPHTYTLDDSTRWIGYDVKVDDGAKLIWNNGQEILVLDPAKYGIQSGQTLTSFAKGLTVVSGGKIDITNGTGAECFYVVSEKAWVDKGASGSAVIGDYDNLLADRQITRYYLYAEKAKAETGSEILSIASTLDPNIEVSLDNTQHVINMTVPSSYVAENTEIPNAVGATRHGKQFTLNFGLSKLATLDVPGKVLSNGGGTTAAEIKSDLGTEENKAAATKFLLCDQNVSGSINGGVGLNANASINWKTGASNWTGYSTDTGTHVFGVNGVNWNHTGNPKPNPGIMPLVVTAEDGKTTTTYEIHFKVADVQEGAELKQVKLGNSTATPVGTIVNLSVPVGTVLNPQKIELDVSKMASVKINGQDYKPTNNYDLRSDLEITVISESGDNRNTYTLKTTVAEGFSDVSTSDWFYNEVTTAATNNWIQGDGNGHFMPYGSMTRVQFATIIARMNGGFDPTDSEGCPFPDVEGTEAQAAAKYVATHNIMQGDADGFRPNDTITRQEAAIVLCKYKGIAPESGTTNYSDDAQIADWAKGYVKAATTANIFQGNGADFDPARQLRRCEGAAILVRSASK